MTSAPVGPSGAPPMQASLVTAQRHVFGVLADGTAIEAVMLTASNGVSARIMTLGAALQALHAPDRFGQITDITLGHDDPNSFVTHHAFWGQTVGRYANRIAGGRFSLDGTDYHLTRNDHGNSLHGGESGFDKAVWTITNVTQGACASVTLALTSPDGDEGYPGNLDVAVTYTLGNHGDLTIDFAATSDRPTIVNLTNHALFNLAGEGAGAGMSGQCLFIPASRYTPLDAQRIPTGELAPVAGTVFDFTRRRLLSGGLGWDHNWVLDKGSTRTPELAARLEDPASGRVLEVLTTEPGLQFYAGNFLDGTVTGKNGHVYRKGDGVALEPQKFPDTPNQSAFGSARIDPGKPYHHRMIYRVCVAE